PVCPPYTSFSPYTTLFRSEVEVPLTAPERRRFGILILITDEILANGIHNGLHNRIASFSGHEQGLAPISHCMRTAVGFLLFFRIDKLKAHGIDRKSVV